MIKSDRKENNDTSTNDSIIVNENSQVILKCPASDANLNAFLIVQWFKDSNRINKLTSVPRYKIMNKNLIIKNVESKDSGKFKCKTITGFGTSEHTYSLIVRSSTSNQTAFKSMGLDIISSKKENDKVYIQGAAPTFTNPHKMDQRTYHLALGSFVKLNCESAALPKPDIMWFKNNEILSEEDYGITR